MQEVSLEKMGEEVFIYGIFGMDGRRSDILITGWRPGGGRAAL
jgi:hypothetical protein